MLKYLGQVRSWIKKMKAVIVGKGLIGKKHGEILKEKFQTEVKYFRRSSSNPDEIDSWGELVKFNPDLIILASPTNLHIEQAIRLSALGKPLFIEKPLSNDLSDLSILLSQIKDKKIPSFLAYVLRFHPGIIRLKEEVLKESPLFVRVQLANNLSCWNRELDSKKTYSAHVNQGGGVLMDMSHEIDYLHYIFGDLDYEINQFEKVGNVTEDAPDTFIASIHNNSGLKGCIYLDYYSHKPERTVWINFKDFSLFLDLKAMKLERYEKRELVHVEEFNNTFSDLYIKQMEYFIENISNPNMMNSIFEAEKVARKLVALNNQYRIS